MKLLFCVMSWKGAQSQVHWSWKHYRQSGLDILGTCPTDSQHEWPADINFCIPVGKAGYASPDLVRRWVNTINMLLHSQELLKYDGFIVGEYDGVFFQPMPKFDGGLWTHRAGGKLNHGEKASSFYHSPWIFDREVGEKIVARGVELVKAGEFELGSPDVFLGRCIDDLKLPWTETGTFSVNGGMLEIPEYWASAKQMVSAGCWYCHGIRTQQQLRDLDACKP